MNRADIFDLFTPCVGLGSDLSYLGYRYNRQRMSAERLAHVFPQAAAFERMYQQQLRETDSPEAA